MSFELGVYSFLDVAAYLNKSLVEGLWEGDDAIIVEPAADISSAIVGADGTPLISVTANRAANITLRLQPTSPTHRQLMTLYQKILNRQFAPFPFSATNTRTGEGGSAVQCMIMARPRDQEGDQASVREWRLFAGAWTPNNISYN